MHKICILVICLLVGTCSLGQVANCGDDSPSLSFGTCATSTCTDVFPIVKLNRCLSSDNCYQYPRVSAPCCGVVVRYYDIGSPTLCFIAKLKAPKVRSGLRELAQTQEILVPTCDGVFLPSNVILEQPLPRTTLPGLRP
jgi:hypothetical protein